MILPLVKGMLITLRCLSPTFLCVEKPLPLVFRAIHFRQDAVAMAAISIPLAFVSTTIRKFKNAITMGITKIKAACVLALILKHHFSLPMSKAS